MSKSDNGPMMYEVFPAVTSLNQVPGFNPLKMIRRMVSPKTGEEVFRLDLQYKKLWFRLRHPEGRIRVAPLRITEQLAIYEAQIYLNREDKVPVCSFTSSISKEEAPNGKYIQAAQDEAVDNALSDAGFGIQLSDVTTPESMRHYGSEIPVSQLGSNDRKTETQGTPVQKPVVQAPKAPEQPATAVGQSPVANVTPNTTGAVRSTAQVQKPQTTAVKQSPTETVRTVETRQSIVQPAVKQTEKTAQGNSPAEAAREQKALAATVQEQVKPVQEAYAAHSALEVLRGGNTAPAAPAGKNTVSSSTVVQADDDKDLPFTFGPSYNNNMTPEEIAAVMTLDQAKAVVVDSGMCKGMTMGEVAEKRPVNLKFYLFGGYRGNNNILKAAARVVYDQLPNAG